MFGFHNRRCLQALEEGNYPRAREYYMANNNLKNETAKLLYDSASVAEDYEIMLKLQNQYNWDTVVILSEFLKKMPLDDHGIFFLRELLDGRSDELQTLDEFWWEKIVDIIMVRHTEKNICYILNLLKTYGFQLNRFSSKSLLAEFYIRDHDLGPYLRIGCSPQTDHRTPRGRRWTSTLSFMIAHMYSEGRLGQVQKTIKFLNENQSEKWWPLYEVSPLASLLREFKSPFQLGALNEESLEEYQRLLEILLREHHQDLGSWDQFGEFDVTLLQEAGAYLEFPLLQHFYQVCEKTIPEKNPEKDPALAEFLLERLSQEMIDWDCFIWTLRYSHATLALRNGFNDRCFAAITQTKESLMASLEQGLSPNAYTGYGESLLEYTMIKNKNENAKELIQVLINFGARLDSLTSSGWFLLHHTIIHADPPRFAILVENYKQEELSFERLQEDRTDGLQLTALMKACQYYSEFFSNRITIKRNIHTLLKAGANLKYVTPRGLTASQFAPRDLQKFLSCIETKKMRPPTEDCVICLTKTPTTAFLPCGHICCCYDCQPFVTKCPICRSEIKTRISTENISFIT